MVLPLIPLKKHHQNSRQHQVVHVWAGVIYSAFPFPSAAPDSENGRDFSEFFWVFMNALPKILLSHNRFIHFFPPLPGT